MSFTDDTHGTITWPGGTVPIERFPFGTGEAAFQPRTGWWWNPTESGRGFSLEVQGSSLFVVAFMYDDAGNPVWYLSAGPMTTPKKYEGDWLQFAGGQTLGGAWRPPGTPTRVGRLAIEFSNEEAATLTFSDVAAARIGTKLLPSLTVPVSTLLAAPNVSYRDYWPFWEVTYYKSITTWVGAYSSDLSWFYKLIFKHDGNGDYTLDSGSTVTVRFSADLPQQCKQTGGPLTFQLGSTDFVMTIGRDLRFQARGSTLNGPEYMSPS